MDGRPPPLGAGPLLESLVPVLPVEAREAHLLREAGDDPPVGPGLPGRIVELRVETQPPLAVAPREVVLAPCGGRKQEIGGMGPGRVAGGGNLGLDEPGAPDRPAP